MIGYNNDVHFYTLVLVLCQTISMLDVDSHKNYRDMYKVSMENNVKLIQHDFWIHENKGVQKKP